MSPLSPDIPSLQDLVARLSTYSGSLLQRLESHLRATNYPLRGNQTVPGVARAILAYILRRHSVLGRGQGPTGGCEPGGGGSIREGDGGKGCLRDRGYKGRDILENRAGGMGEKSITVRGMWGGGGLMVGVSSGRGKRHSREHVMEGVEEEE